MALNSKAMNAYKDVQVTSAVSYADGVQLIQMLFDGLLDALTDAETHIKGKDIAKKVMPSPELQESLSVLKGHWTLRKVVSWLAILMTSRLFNSPITQG